MAQQRITLQLDAHRVPLNVERDKEPLYREAGIRLNERYQYYRKRYPQASAEYLWVLVALETGVLLQSDARKNSIKPIEKIIQQLNQQIQQQLCQ